jgi:hypothetical protein
MKEGKETVKLGEHIWQMWSGDGESFGGVDSWRRSQGKIKLWSFYGGRLRGLFTTIISAFTSRTGVVLSARVRYFQMRDEKIYHFI